MTFVIQEEIEKINNTDLENEKLLTTAFDAEAFNYILNRNHIFLRGKLVKNNIAQFAIILKNLRELDPYYL
jgi:hypothetical protein